MQPTSCCRRPITHSHFERTIGSRPQHYCMDFETDEIDIDIEPETLRALADELDE